MKAFHVAVFLVTLAPGCSGTSDKDYRSNHSLDDPSVCAAGDQILHVQAIDDELNCVDVSAVSSVGCGSGAIPDGLYLYSECWKNKATNKRVVSPVPLANLRHSDSWEPCDDPSDRTWATACQKSDCERHIGSTCSFEDTCAQLTCGDEISPYTASGCVRQKGDPCLKDSDCSAGQVCSFFTLQAGTPCAYRPDGTCFCLTNTLAPPAQGYCTAQ